MNRAVFACPLLFVLSACRFDVPVATDEPQQLPPVPFPFENASGCNASGWCFEEPGIPGGAFADVDGSGDDDIWAVGLNGLVAHSDGNAWQIGVQGTVNFEQVHVVARGHVLFAGANHEPTLPPVTRTAIAFELKDGALSELAIDGRTPERFFSASEDAVWALVPDVPNIDYGAGGPGAIYKKSGDQWLRDLETTHAVSSHFYGFARGPDDAFLVGFTPQTSASGLWHFDGEAWRDIWPELQVTAGVTDDPDDAPSAGSVGEDGSLFLTGSNENGWILRQAPDGAWRAWSRPSDSLIYSVEIDALDENHALMLNGFGDVYELVDDAWARTFTLPSSNDFADALYVNRDGAVVVQGSGNILEKQAGGTWAIERGRPNTGQFRDVWAPPGGEPWAVSASQVLHRQNGAWVDMGVSDAGSHVFGRADDDVWVTTEFTGLHFDGETWSPVNVHGPGAFTSDGSLWFGGCGLGHQRPDASIVAVNGDPNVVTEDPETGCRPWVTRVIAGATGELFVLNNQQTLYRVDTESDAWTVVRNDVADAAFDGRNLWLSTRDARVLKREIDGTFTETAPLPEQEKLASLRILRLRAFGEGHLFVYGLNYYIAEYQDGAWTLDTSLPFLPGGVAGVSLDGDALTAVGGFGSILRRVLP